MKFELDPKSYWLPVFVWDHHGDKKTRRYTGFTVGPWFFGAV